MKLKDSLRDVVPGLASGKLYQIIGSLPTYFSEVSQLRTRRELATWFYFKFPYSSEVPRFPPFISLSVTEKCNFSCVHCFRNLNRPRPEDMDLPLFSKLIDEISEHPGCRLKICGTGEPAVHPHIRDIVSLIAESKVNTIIYTNGTLFERFLPHEIVEAGFRKLVVSIDGIDAQSYKKIRVGGNYDKLRANLARFHQVRSELKSHSPMIEIRHVILQNESSKDLLRFRNDWMKFADAVKFNNLLPLIPQPHSGAPSIFKRCRDIRRILYIQSGGLVTECGYRSLNDTEEILGDLRQSTIKELWEHPILQHKRSCHERNALDDIPFCKNCIEITS